MENPIKPSRIVLIAAGALVFVFSFFTFTEMTYRTFYNQEVESWTAWSSEGGTLLLATWPALIGIAIAVSVALETFTDTSLPTAILTFSRPQLYLGLSIAAALIMISFLFGGGNDGGILDALVANGDLGSEGSAGFSNGVGFWFMLTASIGLVVGSIMELQGADDRSAIGSGQGETRGPATF